MSCYIYNITNKLDNKCYIGQTINDICERYRHHKTISSNCLYLKNAFKKYVSVGLKYRNHTYISLIHNYNNSFFLFYLQQYRIYN